MLSTCALLCVQDERRPRLKQAEDFVAKADADAISGWDQRWALRSMSVSQLLALSR